MIIKPYISEKSLALAKQDQYTFCTTGRVNKITARKLAEDLFGLKVLSVTVLNDKPAERRFRGKPGRTKSFKKIILKIKKGAIVPGFETTQDKTSEKSGEKTQKAAK